MYIKIDEVQYNVEIIGEGKKKLVCLHGFSENLSTWNMLQALSSEFTLYLIDLIGHGKTKVSNDMKYFSFEYITYSLDKLFEHLNLNEIYLLGYSMGGRIALSYAINYPNRIHKLVLESTNYGIESDLDRINRLKKDQALADKIRSNDIKFFADYWTNLDIFNSQRDLSDEVREGIYNRRLNNDPNRLANALIGFSQGNQENYLNKLKQLEKFVLIIVGRKDEKYLSIGKTMYLELKNSKLVVLNSGHNTHIEKPDEFLKVIKEEL